MTNKHFELLPPKVIKLLGKILDTYFPAKRQTNKWLNMYRPGKWKKKRVIKLTFHFWFVIIKNEEVISKLVLQLCLSLNFLLKIATCKKSG